ncbi:predicted GPI-anchored protein 58 [Neovison vison]|uniref:predicted GPI-anchored protein 58 n=1 Tax=Neovison vison TaxID=452646 RepID=UPI001CF0B441|nr:predicted GPI-anchored protein 58 [Neogale vison]
MTSVTLTAVHAERGCRFGACLLRDRKRSVARNTSSAGSPLQQLPSPSPSPRELILSGGKAAPPATEPPRSISAPRAPPPLPERGPHSRARRPRRPLCACGLPPCCTPVDFAPHAAVWHPRLLQVLIPRPDSQFPCDPASWPPSAPRTSQAMSNPKPADGELRDAVATTPKTPAVPARRAAVSRGLQEF